MNSANDKKGVKFGQGNFLSTSTHKLDEPVEDKDAKKKGTCCWKIIALNIELNFLYYILLIK